MKRIPQLGEHLRLKAATELLAKLRRDFRETEDALNSAIATPGIEKPLSAAERALLAGDDPGQIDLTGNDDRKAQLAARLTALARAIARQDELVRDLHPVARREMIAEHGLRETERQLLAAVKKEAERFGAACTLLDKFYDECRDADLALVPGHSWPLHPGTLSDPNSNLNGWLRGVGDIAL